MGIRIRPSEQPKLRSCKDNRRRIDIVSPQLTGSKYLSGEYVIYGPGDKCPDHWHTRAEHIFLVTEGSGWIHFPDKSLDIQKGDAVFVPPNEPHWLEAGENGITFAEFFGPIEPGGAPDTVWEQPELR